MHVAARAAARPCGAPPPETTGTWRRTGPQQAQSRIALAPTNVAETGRFSRPPPGTNVAEHGKAWPLKIVAAKHRAVESAWKVADLALELAGGFGIFAASGIERLLRDARLGRIHPASPALAHEIVGKLSLGINPDEQPRWG